MGEMDLPNPNMRRDRLAICFDPLAQIGGGAGAVVLAFIIAAFHQSVILDTRNTVGLHI